MILWDDAITTCQELAGDDDSTIQTFLKRMMNHGQQIIYAQLGKVWTEKTKTTVTVEDQQYYQMPRRFKYPKSITVTVGSTIYPLIEEESQEMWDLLNRNTQTSAIPSKYFVRPRFGIDGTEIGIWPVPSTDDYTITVVYESSAKDLSQSAYTTGTVTVTNGSATLAGSSTVWIAPMVDRYFTVTDATGDGNYYRITARSSNTALTIENNYEGTTTAGAGYKIAEAFQLPEEMHMLPIYYALWHYFKMQQNKDEAQQYQILFSTGLLESKRYLSTKSTSNIIRSHNLLGLQPDYPRNWPASISE